TQLMALAIDSLLLHSAIPLRMATYFGLFLSVATTLGAFIYVVQKVLVGNQWPAGFATLAVFTLLSLGINSLFLGILGEYVLRIYRQSSSPDGVIIDEQIDAASPDSSRQSKAN